MWSSKHGKQIWMCCQSLIITRQFSICVSISLAKSKTKTFQALIQNLKESKQFKLIAKEAICKFAPPFATSRQISSQELVWYCFPELWKRKGFPRNIFVNKNIQSQSKRVKLCKSEKEIMELDPKSTDIFKCNMIERYIYWPETMFQIGCCVIVDRICLAIFLSYCFQKDRYVKGPDVKNEKHYLKYLF